MKNKKILIILGVVALACAILLCVGAIIVFLVYRQNNPYVFMVPPIGDIVIEKNPVSNPAVPPVSTQNQNNVSYQIVDRNESDATSGYLVDNTYPEIQGYSNATTESDFNQYVKDSILGVTREVKFLDPNLETGKNTLELTYKVEYSSDDLISIMISGYEYTGGAHGINVFVPINYDLKNNQKIELADFFKTGSSYLAEISTYSIADLKDQLGLDADQDWIEDGAAAKAENYQSFTFSEQGLRITFTDYQVAAYAAGPQYVLIPWAELQSILNPQFANL